MKTISEDIFCVILTLLDNRKHSETDDMSDSNLKFVISHFVSNDTAKKRK